MQITGIKNLGKKQKILILGIILTAILLLVVSIIGNLKCAGVEKIVKIEKGMGSDETAQKLKDEGVISNKWFFVFYVWAKGDGSHLQAGEYLLNSQMSIPQIARIIVNGEVNENYVKITIPEGWDIKKIEERLKENNVIDNNAKISIDNEG